MYSPGSLNLEIVENFIYLGSNISATGSCETEVRRRIGLAKSAMSQLHRTWKDRNISIKTKVRLVRALIFPIFTYAAETWTIKAADRQRIDAFEMWCWRRMLRIPWTARRTNASILRQLKITRRLSTTCLKRILEYFGHIARRDGDNLEKIVVTGKVEGKRPRGRSPIRWSDQIRTVLDTKVHTALNVAQSRVKWLKIVQKVVSGRGHDPQQ
ncbi:jg14263 [Pararge aegeria aegeria]|uniref:Jg14263 protein n=1 Tax=Pararge aegeria aegeria TaxID=348720 RepID=A0A8S4QK36_9NEOP|nr:jg14263 [Pararge aegeria aegeria]